MEHRLQQVLLFGCQPPHVVRFRVGDVKAPVEVQHNIREVQRSRVTRPRRTVQIPVAVAVGAFVVIEAVALATIVPVARGAGGGPRPRVPPATLLSRWIHADLHRVSFAVAQRFARERVRGAELHHSAVVQRIRATLECLQRPDCKRLQHGLHARNPQLGVHDRGRHLLFELLVVVATTEPTVVVVHALRGHQGVSVRSRVIRDVAHQLRRSRQRLASVPVVTRRPRDSQGLQVLVQGGPRQHRGEQDFLQICEPHVRKDAPPVARVLAEVGQRDHVVGLEHLGLRHERELRDAASGRVLQVHQVRARVRVHPAVATNENSITTSSTSCASSFGFIISHFATCISRRTITHQFVGNARELLQDAGVLGTVVPWQRRVVRVLTGCSAALRLRRLTVPVVCRNVVHSAEDVIERNLVVFHAEHLLLRRR
mmetsp:Transcript_23245/g.58758  ORF Transcript_23245/g.58758 Transcript_23245/m.58758 type:complete len:427 (-) Transcript_23245:2207-3487(-)